ncbi:hypothetical protein PSI9734_01954 [Pseudidiomarina piscicola]|uniref:DUF3014 domain-containing protein n=1 Tax=Pseudidiomarina piscicola TaxID=2614830 RepID=A0A6S6WPG8_9GAMM|nr:DUF3014 domain-containing protein [Pseudidiomarina piscicola]CAB0151580.1 hypothetical protein PSI9734_01954 [Pseudidiomarina piscicola]VZT41045.1 hypothetical protein PSI9734_01954 [Pseudomonas aeruginosa]
MNDHDANNSPQPAGKGKLIAALLVVIALAVVVIWYLATDQQSSSSTPPAPKVVEAPVAAPEAEEPQQELVADPADTVELGEQTPTETEPQPPEPVEPEPELPSLSNSTAAVVADLAAAEQPVEPLQSEQLIRDAVVFLDNIRNGVVVRDAAPVSGPKGRFRVLEQDDKIYIDPRSYDRYNTVVDWFVSLDVDTMTTLLDRYQPLVNEALAEIGYPDAQADRVVLDAIEVLMATPSVGTVIELNDDSVMYRYADPALEALSDAQKQMLRLGPDNMRRVKLKLEALQAALQDE